MEQKDTPTPSYISPARARLSAGRLLVPMQSCGETIPFTLRRSQSADLQLLPAASAQLASELISKHQLWLQSRLFFCTRNTSTIYEDDEEESR